jgi:hypothetical protein
MVSWVAVPSSQKKLNTNRPSHHRKSKNYIINFSAVTRVFALAFIGRATGERQVDIRVENPS